VDAEFKDHRNWVLAGEISGDLEAQIIKGLLEAQEIDVLLFHEGAGGAIGLTVGPLAVVQIMVRAEDQARAQELLENYYAEGGGSGDVPAEPAG
jgi:hypothetical protein